MMFAKVIRRAVLKFHDFFQIQTPTAKQDGGPFQGSGTTQECIRLASGLVLVVGIGGLDSLQAYEAREASPRGAWLWEADFGGRHFVFP